MFRNRFLTLFFSLVLIGTLTGSAVAQTPRASAIPPIREFPGIQAAVSRTYSLDIESMLAATPGLDPLSVHSEITAISIMVLQFDNAVNAAAAFDVFSNGLRAELPSFAQGGTPEVTGSGLADVGSQASVSTLRTTSGETETWLRHVTVQRDEYLFIVSSLTGTEEMAEVANNLAAGIANNGKPAGDEAIFVAEGGSTGGLWGFMPETGEQFLAGLIPVSDETLYPDPAHG